MLFVYLAAVYWVDRLPFAPSHAALNRGNSQWNVLYICQLNMTLYIVISYFLMCIFFNT